MRIRLSILIFFVSFIGAFAQASAPKYSNEYMHLGIDAKAMGMGGAHVSLTNDVFASYWNPAGLINNKHSYEIGGVHTDYLSGSANYNYIGFMMKIDSVSALGVSVLRFGVDNEPDTRSLITSNNGIQEGIPLFPTTDYGILLSYARAYNNWRIGGNTKLIYRKIDDFATVWGIGFDFGIQKTIGSWEIGTILRDGIGTYNTWFINTDEIAQPFAQSENDITSNSLEISLPRLIPGIHRVFQIKDSVLFATGALDLETTFDGKRNTLIRSSILSINPHIGMEIDYKHILFLRTGILNFQRENINEQKSNWRLQSNIGIGFKVKKLSVDYALLNLGQLSEDLYSHVLSLKLEIK